MFRILSILVFLGTFSLSAQAVSIDPYDCDDTLYCWTVDTTSALHADDVATEVGTSTELVLYYKQDFGGGESGIFSDNYETSFTGFDSSGEPTGADIIHDIGDLVSISCPECYLVVKDGSNGNPSQYIIDLASWNGLDTLSLSGFWDGSGVAGAISHVAIYGDVSAVPVPAAIWLFGTALIGLVGFGKRKLAV